MLNLALAKAGDIIGYGSRGPIRLAAGGSQDAAIATPPITTTTSSANPAAPTITVTEPPASKEPEQLAAANGRKTPTWEDVEKARREEKDKLYPQLEDLKKSVTELAGDRARRIQLEKEAEDRATSEAEAARQAELTWQQRIEEQTAGIAAQLQTEREERRREQALFEKEREYSGLQTYRAEALATAGDAVMPHLTDFVTGNSREEIDAAIARAQSTTTAILGEVQERMQFQRQAMPGTSVTAPAMGPSDTQAATRTFSEEELRRMPMSEYMKYRDQLLPAASKNQRDQGMYR